MCVLLGQPHCSQLRIGEDRVRHDPGGHGPQVLGMQDVVPHSASLGTHQVSHEVQMSSGTRWVTLHGEGADKLFNNHGV
jgi:hypothetical protein